jgi:hypothetical protein
MPHLCDPRICEADHIAEASTDLERPPRSSVPISKKTTPKAVSGLQGAGARLGRRTTPRRGRDLHNSELGIGSNGETVKPCYFAVIDERHITSKGATA